MLSGHNSRELAPQETLPTNDRWDLTDQYSSFQAPWGTFSGVFFTVFWSSPGWIESQLLKVVNLPLTHCLLAFSPSVSLFHSLVTFPFITSKLTYLPPDFSLMSASGTSRQPSLLTKQVYCNPAQIMQLLETDSICPLCQMSLEHLHILGLTHLFPDIRALYFNSLFLLLLSVSHLNASNTLFLLLFFLAFENT